MTNVPDEGGPPGPPFRVCVNGWRVRNRPDLPGLIVLDPDGTIRHARRVRVENAVVIHGERFTIDNPPDAPGLPDRAAVDAWVEGSAVTIEE